MSNEMNAIQIENDRKTKQCKAIVGDTHDMQFCYTVG